MWVICSWFNRHSASNLFLHRLFIIVTMLFSLCLFANKFINNVSIFCLLFSLFTEHVLKLWYLPYTVFFFHSEPSHYCTYIWCFYSFPQILLIFHVLDCLNLYCQWFVFFFFFESLTNVSHVDHLDRQSTCDPFR